RVLGRPDARARAAGRGRARARSGGSSVVVLGPRARREVAEAAQGDQIVLRGGGGSGQDHHLGAAVSPRWGASFSCGDRSPPQMSIGAVLGKPARSIREQLSWAPGPPRPRLAAGGMHGWGAELPSVREDGLG